jgi:hypothetical protein
MSPYDLITACRARGISLEVRGEQLRCRAPVGVMTPDLKQALADQKTSLLQILAVEALAASPRNLDPHCAVIAVKAWSEVLQEAIWVVIDGLPRDQWPRDAPVYTHAEVAILARIDPNTLSWVHITKQMFGARVVHPRYTAKGKKETPLNRYNMSDEA